MIKYTENGATQNIIKVMKDGHEAHRMLHNDRLVFSPFLIMGTTYESTSKQMWSRGDSSQLGTDLYSTFEILGEAGEDDDGTYYYFGFRVIGVMRNGNRALPNHFKNEINYFFEQNYSPLTTYFRTVDQFNCTGNYTLDKIPILGQRTGLKEVDFKWFNCKNKSQFIPLAFATNCTSVKNLDKITFNNSINCYSAFRECKFDTFVWYSDTLHYINNLYQTWQNCTNVSLITFATQEQDNTLLHELTYTFDGCTNVNRIDIANLKLINLQNANSAFRNCYNLYHNPLGGLPTSAITNWQSTYENCRTLIGSQFDTNDYSSAINMASCFKGCSGITSLDLSTKNLSNVANFDSTWQGCSQLSSLSLPQIKPTYMQSSFNGTALYNIPANIDFSDCLNTSSMCANCTNFEGGMNFSNHEFSAVTLSPSMFYGCKNVYSYTFKQGAFHNSTNMNSMFERNTYLTSITNLDMTNATSLNSIFYLDSELLQVTGTKPTSAVSVNWFLHGCSKLQRFIDFSNLKVKNNTQFGVGSLPSLNNDLHIETWTNEDGTGKPIVWFGQYYGFPTITTEDLTHEYDIDPQGWIFLSKQGTTNNNAFLIFSNCKYPIINLDKIKVRVVNDSSGNVVPIKLENAFTNSKITEIDTTNWLDNTDVPSLTRLPIYSNQNMFDGCTWLTKIVIKNLDFIESSNSASFGNNKVFNLCSAVTSFTCEYQFFDIVKQQILDLHYMTQWVNPTEIEAFFNQLTTVTSKQYTATGNNFRFNLSSQTNAVFQGLSNYTTIYSAMLSHGWEII